MAPRRSWPWAHGRSSPAAARSVAASASRDQRHLKANAGTAVAAVVVGFAMLVAAPMRLGSLLLVGTMAVVALDAVVAVQATRRAVMSATTRPTDAVVGDRYAIEVTVTGPALPVLVNLASEPESRPVLVVPPTSGRFERTARARGVFRVLQLSAVSSGLCGLLSCSRTHLVHLARPLEVGPRPVVPAQPFPELGGGWGEGTAGAAPDGELVRGLRDYVPGDRLRQVHWRATARHGELVVKEVEEPQAPVLHLVVDLGAGGDDGEAAAGRGAWYAREALLRGCQVTLTTVEDGHPLTDATPSLLAVNRRLARAGRGTPPRPQGVARGVRVLVVSDEGDSWPS